MSVWCGRWRWPQHGQHPQGHGPLLTYAVVRDSDLLSPVSSSPVCAGLYAFLTHPPILPDDVEVLVSVPTAKKERRSLTPWELPSLLTPVHLYRRSAEHCPKERPHFAAILGFVYRNR